MDSNLKHRARVARQLGVRLATSCLPLMAAMAAPCARSEAEQTLEKVVVEGTSSKRADTASVGTIGKRQLDAHPAYRPGELLESVPGLIVSQHSGEGKANQFYLRGFNLDHGTDLRTTVDGMLVNQRSHGHGQGWTDLNFLIPELVSSLDYKKGPYFASEGDFSSAGAVSVNYTDRLDRGIASVGLGGNGFRRLLLADSPTVGQGKLLYALEAMHNDGPFVNPDDFGKLNAVLRYSAGDAGQGFNLTAMGYRARWNSSDQLPKRAVDAGQLGRFDAIDTSDGGESHRYSLSSAGHRRGATSSSHANAYLIDWQLKLFSNFTYFLDDPVNGDQFSQPDRRRTVGINAGHTWQQSGLGVESENTVGLQFQNDNIFNGLLHTKQRETLSVTRRDHIVETSLGLFADNATRWTPWFRTVAGVRIDSYRFNVSSDNPANSGRSTATMANPKLALVFGPWQKTELFLNLGGGFHSNDARGTTLTVDPKTGEPAEMVQPLVRGRGLEAGLRSSLLPGWQSTLAFYRLDVGSELVFLGDAGTTEAGRPSRRVGFEWANTYKLSDWLSIDADVALARARFRDSDPEGLGHRIPGAVEGVASLSIALDRLGPWSGALQLRYFGPRPLVEDNSVRSRATGTLNGRIGYQLNERLRVDLEGFNLTQARASAIDYYYLSRLPHEAAAGVEDVHFHPIESRSIRASLTMNF